MKPVTRTANDLFQKLRTRYSPVTLGNEKAEATSDPDQARFFNFIYSEDEENLGPVSISIVDGRSMKVFFSDNIVENMVDKEKWYSFLRELRAFAKRNMMVFDARDITKSQLDTRDFSWLSKTDGKMDETDVVVSESTMWGSKRRSYQALESVKMIVQHTKTVDESKPGARSRSIQAIYLERQDGERYKFPFNYLTGARAMARHISEGGTPYDPMGQHILGMIREMRDLSKFARMTRTHALEDSAADETRQKVVERFRSLKGTLGAIGHKSGYDRFKESFSPQESTNGDNKLDELRERFTRKIWDTNMEELLPAVMRAIESAEINEAPASVEKQIKDVKRLLVLKRDPAADQMIRNTKFTDASGLMGYILSDIAQRAIGDDMDALANFAADVAERVNDQELDPRDKQLGMVLAKRYIDDIKKMATDKDYAEMIRKDPSEVYGRKKKRTGGFHESDAFEAWVNGVMATEAEELDELQTLSGTTRVDPRDPKAMTKAALGKVGITTGEDPKTGALTVGKGANRQQVQAALKAISAKSKGKLNPTVVMQGTENDAEPVMEKELRVKGDQDSDGDEDFADVMIARRVKSGEPKDKAIAATKDKPYNEADVNEDKLMAESLSLLRTLSGI